MQKIVFGYKFSIPRSIVQFIVPFYQQGDVIRICIKPDTIAESDDGLFMKKIDLMSFKKR